MDATIEPAPSGRATCRGCRRRIPKGELRLGEHLPNPFADEGTMSLWLHLRCGAYKRPEALLAALEATGHDVPGRDELVAVARHGAEHRRLPRLDGAQRAPTGRARCRACKETIPKDAWRLSLVYYDEGRFEPSGFIHLACCEDYVGTTDVLDRVVHFEPSLSEDDLGQLRAALAGAADA